jgi:hypothetical protein
MVEEMKQMKNNTTYFSLIFVLFFGFSLSPPSYFIFIILISIYSIYGLLSDRRVHDKEFFGNHDKSINKKDKVVVFYQILIISSYAYVISCGFIGVLFVNIVIMLVGYTYLKKLNSKELQRKFFYKASIIIGLSYSFIVAIFQDYSILSAISDITGKVITSPTNLCDISKVFDAFNALSASIFALFPFPFNLILVPLNLNLLLGPLVAVGVLALVKGYNSWVRKPLGSPPSNRNMSSYNSEDNVI